MMSTLTITTIQANLAWEDKLSNLKHFESRISTIGQNTELVILPEMFSTGFSMQSALLAETMEGETVQWMKNTAAKYKVILTGSLIIRENNEYFNRLVWMLPNGQMGYYDKRHLFCLSGEHEHFTRGNKRLIASVKGWKINLQVCYDLRFPVWSRNRLVDGNSIAGAGNEAPVTKQIPEYDLLIYVANWPEKRVHAWRTLLQARAIENQCFVIGVNRVGEDGNGLIYNGNSMVLDPMGEILYQGENREDTSTITLTKQVLEEVRAKLPFWQDGDDFNLL
jgi:predicted amidohydrolase